MQEKKNRGTGKNSRKRNIAIASWDRFSLHLHTVFPHFHNFEYYNFNHDGKIKISLMLEK